MDSEHASHTEQVIYGHNKWYGVLELTAIPTTHAEIFYTTCIDQDCIRPVKQPMLLMSVW